MKKNIDLLLILLAQIISILAYMFFAFIFLNETLFNIGIPTIILGFLILIYKRGKKHHEGEFFWIFLLLFDIIFFAIIIPLIISIIGSGLAVGMSPR